MKRFLVLVGVFACSNEVSPSKPVAPVVTPIAAADATVTAPPDARDIRAELNLPARNVDAKEIIWRPEAEVFAAFGKGVTAEDNSSHFDIGDGRELLVWFADGRAVGLEIPKSTTGFTTFDRPKKDVAASYFGVGTETKNGVETWTPIRGRAIRLGDAFDRSGLAVYEAEFIEGQHKRLADRQRKSAAAEAIRKELDESLSMLSEGNVHVALDGAQLVIKETADATCDAKALRDIRKTVVAFLKRDLPDAGISGFRCANNGVAIGLR